MHQPTLFAANPTAALDQTNIAGRKALDGSSVSGNLGFIRVRRPQSCTVDSVLRQPFATGSNIGRDEAHRQVVAVKAWAHGTVKQAQAKTDGTRLE